MENGTFPFREALPEIVKGCVVGTVPGAVVGASIPGVVGFALLGIISPRDVAAYFAFYFGVILFGGLLGAAIGGSMGACRWVEKGCPEMRAQQMRWIAVAGAVLAPPLAYAIWLLARQLALVLF